MTESTKTSTKGSKNASRDDGWTAASIVDAGGIASARAKTDPTTTGTLVALSFEHPAVAERTVVRLVEESLVDPTDAEMRTLGFVRVGEATEVGRARKRAIGFPAWALVHHPKKASFALDVMREFRKAAMRARTKPGHARDAFVEIGKRLERSVPAFMPSFWEEVARVFLAEDATGIAGQCFERARTAERAYKLPVDEDVRAAAYLEFTTAGAVPAKSLVGYAADLTKAFGAKEAAARFSRLNVQRIKAGLPPWNGMAKELRKLAAAAKDPSIEESFLREVVTASGLKKAPLDFWTTYREPLVALAKESSEVRASLSRLWPAARGARSKLVSAWLGVLDEVGAIDSIAEGPAPEIAAFLGALTRYATERDYGDDAPIDARYFEILTRLAPPLVAAKQPVDLLVGMERRRELRAGRSRDGARARARARGAEARGDAGVRRAVLEEPRALGRTSGVCTAGDAWGGERVRARAVRDVREGKARDRGGAAAVSAREDRGDRGGWPAAAVGGARVAGGRAAGRAPRGDAGSRGCDRGARGRCAAASSTSSRGRPTRRSSRASVRRRRSRRTARVRIRSCARVGRSWCSTGRRCCGATTCRPR